MKPIILNKNTLFYKWLDRSAGLKRRPWKVPQDICSLTSLVMAEIGLILLQGAIIFLVVFALSVLLYHTGSDIAAKLEFLQVEGWIQFPVYFLIGALPITIFLVAVGLMISLGYSSFWAFKRLFYRNEYREPTLVGRMYQSWRDKTCIPIEFQDKLTK